MNLVSNKIVFAQFRVFVQNVIVEIRSRFSKFLDFKFTIQLKFILLEKNKSLLIAHK